MKQLVLLAITLVTVPAAGDVRCGDFSTAQLGNAPPKLVAIANQVAEGKTLPSDIEDFLIGELDSPSPANRTIAAETLARSGDKRFETRLTTALEREWFVRARIRISVAMFEAWQSEVAAQDFVLPLECQQTRNMAIESAYRAPSLEQIPFLLDAWQRGWGSKEAVIRAAARIESEATVPLALEYLGQGRDRNAMRGAVQIVARHGAAKDLDEMFSFLSSKPPVLERSLLVEITSIGETGRTVLARRFEVETGTSRRRLFASVILDSYLPIGQRRHQPLSENVVEALLDRTNTVYFSVLGWGSDGEYLDWFRRYAAAMTSTEDRVAFWQRTLMLVPSPCEARAGAEIELARVMAANPETRNDALHLYDQATPFVSDQSLAREIATVRALVTRHALRGYMFASGIGRFHISVQNTSDLDLALPGTKDDELQIWVDCWNGWTLISSRRATVVDASDSIGAKGSGTFVIETEICEPTPGRYISARVFAFPGANPSLWFGSFEVRGTPRASNGGK